MVKNKLKKLIKKWLQAFIIKELSFLFVKKVIIKLKKKSILMYWHMQIKKCIQFIYQKKILKTYEIVFARK